MTNLYRNLWEDRELIFYLAKSERKASLFRFFLGEAWYFFVPLAQALIYYFLLAIVLQAKVKKDR